MNTRLLNSQPWRFRIGERVFVRGWSVLEEGYIVEMVQPAPGGFPHYLVATRAGAEWQIAQLELSRSPIGMVQNAKPGSRKRPQ